MISNNRGILQISKELYEKDELINPALFALEIKVYGVDYEPFHEIYRIRFTSPFCEETVYGYDTPVYSIRITKEDEIEQYALIKE